MQAPAPYESGGAAKAFAVHTSLLEWRIAHEAGVDDNGTKELYR